MKKEDSKWKGMSLIFLCLILLVSVEFTDAFFLPDTKQTKCYSVKGPLKVVTCPSPGNAAAQDGSYTINPPLYSSISNDTIQDNNTGLIWQQRDDGIVKVWDEAVSYCENLSLDGYTDWRLPTEKELISIMDYGRYNPSVDPIIFPNAQPSYYWSSTTAIDNADKAWTALFNFGYTDDYYSKLDTFFVRCVRGSYIAFGDFIDNHNNTVTDRSTGLMWQQAEAGLMNWASALSYCENLSLGGNADWRLPNIKELASLSDDSKYNPAIDSLVFPFAHQSFYWSSTTCSSGIGFAFATNFLDGMIDGSSKSNSNYVRCVRGERTPSSCGELTTSQRKISFGIVAIGDSSSQDLTVTNLGTGPLVIGQITGPSLPFSIFSDGCSGRAISPGQSCSVIISFSPTLRGVFADKLTISSSDAEHPIVEINLAGNTDFLLPDTGYTACYDNSGNLVACPPPGDPYARDGSYIINPSSYTVNFDGTLTDNNTSFMWQQDDNGQFDSWYKASGTYHKRYNKNTSDICGNLTLAGYTDWKLPDPKELESIVNYGTPYIDRGSFPNTHGACYWTSDNHPSYPTAAWTVDFGLGQITSNAKENDCYIRCMRRDFGFNNFINNNNWTITDKALGLMWMQYPASVDEGKGTVYCEGLNYAGFSDWRLPNIRELASLTDFTRSDPPLNTAFFPQSYSEYNHAYFWSSTGSWFIDLIANGRTENYIDNNTRLACALGGGMGTYNCGSFARCVRNVTSEPKPGVLAGTVTDLSSGIPISDVTVTVTDSAKTYYATTGTDGKYTITNIIPGGFTAIFEKPGYFPQTMTCSLTAGQTLTTDIHLTPLPPLAVTITSPQDGAVVNTSTITVTGSVSNNATVTVNRIQAAVINGLFSALTFVKEGQNTLTVSAADQYGQAASNSITVMLTGLLDSQEIFASPSSLNFGTINIYRSSSLGIVISNIGRGDLIIGTISGPSLPFTISSDGCSGKTLPESGSCWITVKFALNIEGTFTSSLIIPSTDADHPDITIDMDGTATLYQDAYFLPDTGQNECYDIAGNIINCQSTGQDGSHLMNPMSYATNDDGTVSDNNTGLMWQKEDDNSLRTWADAQSYCENLSLAGYIDWRLPIKRELLSIVDYGQYEPSIDSTVFPNTKSADYWTLTTSFNNAFTVNYRYGEVSSIIQSGRGYVRCVRGRQLPESSPVDNGDGTVTDLSTGLMWMQQETADTKDWPTALTICENGTYAGYSDWRLPNIRELASLYANCRDWSSTTVKANASQAYVINSCDGLLSAHNKSLTDYYVRCVRGGYASSGTITGSVTDASSGLPLQAAEVSVNDSLNNTKTAFTGTDGTYMINGISAGDFSGSIVKDGYNAYSFSEIMSPNRTITVDAAMTKSFAASTLGDYGNVTVVEVAGSYNAKNPDGSLNMRPRQEIAKEFLRTHPDQYDFIVIFSNFDFSMPDENAKGFYLEVKNDVQGIGKPLFDNSTFFGSNGKLQGTIDMGNILKVITNPVDSKFEETISTLAHEQMHRWGANAKFRDSDGNVSTALLGKDGCHWSFLLDTDGSVLYGNDWKDNGNGTFTSASASIYYGPLDLYLMGMCDKSQVPPMLLIDNQVIDPTKLPEIGATISGMTRYITIDDIIAAEGERIPSVSASQKAFRTAFVLITRPGTFNINELPGIENVRNAWAGRFSALTNGKGSIADVAPTLTISISSPSDGDTISRPDVTVKGAIINSTGKETGVTVNGIVAIVNGNQFIAGHIPLAEGSNILTVTATDTDGNTATASITVDAVTTGNYISLTSNIESGIAPLEVMIRIDGSFSITESNLNITGPVQPELLASSPDEYKIAFVVEGTYAITANAMGPDGNIYQDAIEITVMNRTQIDNLLKAKWQALKTALVNQNVNDALNYFTDDSKEIYSDIYNAFYDQLPQLIQDMQDIQLIYAKNRTAKYRLRENELYGGMMETLTYNVYFVNDRDGLWKIYRY